MIVAIIGFGFCGRLAFFNLTKNPNKNLKILIFDNKGSDYLGPAFSEFNKSYILNVTANKMSIFPDSNESDFCNFLASRYPDEWKKVGKDGYAPRYIYGKYMEDFTRNAFENAKKNGVEFEFVEEEVMEVKNSFSIKTKSQRKYKADEILLATSFKQSEVPFKVSSKNFIEKLWDQKYLNFHNHNFSNDETICLLGSGLTAVDVIVGLRKKGFTGKIFVISRRGNLPKKHCGELDKIPCFISPEDGKNGILFLSLKVRRFLEKNPQYDLRHIINSIRPIISSIWHNLDQANKRKFLRFMPYWNIFRHCAPSSSIEIIEDMISSGQLELKRKGVKSVTNNDAKIIVRTSEETIECDYFVNCLGFNFNFKKYPLLNQMVEDKLLSEDVLLVKSNHQKIHLLGGLNIGKDFECTSVPDLQGSVNESIAKISLQS